MAVAVVVVVVVISARVFVWLAGQRRAKMAAAICIKPAFSIYPETCVHFHTCDSFSSEFAYIYIYA